MQLCGPNQYVVDSMTYKKWSLVLRVRTHTLCADGDDISEGTGWGQNVLAWRMERRISSGGWLKLGEAAAAGPELILSTAGI